MNENNQNTKTDELLARITAANGGRYAPPRPEGLARAAAEDDVPPEAASEIEAQTAEALNAACGEQGGSTAALCALLWPGQDVSPEQEAFATRHALALQARANESAPLMAVIGLLWKEDVARWHDDFRGLKKHLRSLGLTNGGWTLLSHEGGRLWKAALGTPRFADAPLGTVISLANGVAAQGRDVLPPDAVVRLLVDADGHMALGDEKRLFAPRLLRAVWNRWEEGQEGQPFSDLVQEIVDVVDWWHRSEQYTVDIPAGAGWSWFRDAATAWWSREEAASRAIEECWPASLAACDVDGYQVVPLADPVAVWDEARLMRHCLYDEISLRISLKDGAIAAFSIRREGAKRPVATFTARRRTAVIEPALGRERTVLVLSEVKGFANLKVDVELVEVARRYLATQQPEVFSRTFGPADFVEEQDVLLVRPEWPANLGRTGWICSLEPVTAGEPHQRGDCQVDWNRGYAQPANFSQMAPLTRDVGHSRGEFDKGDGVGCTVCGEVGCQRHLVGRLKDFHVLEGPLVAASAVLYEMIREDVFEQVVCSVEARTYYSRNLADDFLRRAKDLELLKAHDERRARAMFDREWDRLELEDELRVAVWRLVADDEASSLIEDPVEIQTCETGAAFVYAEDPLALITRATQRLLGQPTDDWLYEQPMRLVVCAVSEAEPVLWLQVHDHGRWTGKAAWNPEEEGKRRNPLAFALVDDLKQWREGMVEAAPDPETFHQRGLALAERVRASIPSQIAVLYARADASLTTPMRHPWVEVLGAGTVRAVDPRAIEDATADGVRDAVCGMDTQVAATDEPVDASEDASVPTYEEGTGYAQQDDEDDSSDVDDDEDEAYDEDEEYEDGYEDNGDRCPICKRSLQDGECEHLLLGLDRQEGAVSGALYGEWSGLVEEAKRRVFDALVENRATGEGARLDALKDEIAGRFDWREHVEEPEHVDDEQDPEDAFDAFGDVWMDVQGDEEVASILQDALESLPEVYSTYFEISTAPGLSWQGENYWAKDTNAAIAEFHRRLAGEGKGG